MCVSTCLSFVRKGFPVGREWKPLADPWVELAPFRPKGLSRWKGMETPQHNLSSLALRHAVRKDFPVGREWKRKQSHLVPLSRFDCVRKGFPVGREWKHWQRECSPHQREYVRKGFPVGREWKLLRSSVVSALRRVRKGFPVGREWKQNLRCVSDITRCVMSERAFPLEGNGNGICKSVSFRAFFRPKGLARWKGMETCTPGPRASSSVRRSERACPLEGNGNQLTSQSRRTCSTRRLKGLSRSNGIETIVRTLSLCTQSRTSERAFPVKRNRNNLLRLFLNPL